MRAIAATFAATFTATLAASLASCLAVMGGAGVIALGVGLPAPALANGRFPESQRVLEHPSDPNRLIVTATYGLLVSNDRGQNWYSICERAFALAYLTGDPLLEIQPDGNLVAGIATSLNVSRDCGCGWQATLEAGQKGSVSDLTIDSSGHLLAIVRDLSSGSALVRLHESSDSGKTWSVLANLPDTINDAYTVDVAPSDANRIYLTAVTDMAQNPALLLTSRDRGKTWSMAEIPGTSNAVAPYIAAIHPTNADRIFVRTDDWDGPDDYAAQDALLQTTDGGKTWTELLRKNAKLFGFALSPDGNTVLAGYGDPVQAGGRTANSDDFGIYKASAAGVQFERIYAAAISCLRWTGQGVYACMVQNHPDLPSPGMSLGFAPNANFAVTTANPFTSLLDVKKVKGPLACVASLCTDWSVPAPNEGAAAVCEQLGATCAVDASKNVLACAGSVGSGGAGGGAGGAGAGGAGGAGAVDGGRDAGMGSGGTSGCLCALPAPSGGSGGGELGAALSWLSSLAALVALATWRRRRCRPKLLDADADADE